MNDNELLVRPAQHPLERVDDYIERLAYENGFSSAKKLRVYLYKWHKERYQDIGGKKKGFFYRAKILSLYFDRKMDIKLFNWSNFIISLSEFKGCRDCFSEKRVIFHYWYLEDYETCHIHNKALDIIKRGS